MPAMTSIVIVAPTRFYREGLAEVLPRRQGLHVTGTAAERDEARLLVAELRPDVVLLDAGLPGARDLVSGAFRIVVIGVDGGEDEVVEWAEAGVAGYVPRDGSLDDLSEAVHAAARGELRCSPRVAACIQRRLVALSVLVAERPAAGAPVQLTAREREVVELIALGRSNKGIARHLGIGMPTAKNHVHNILAKLQVEHRDEAAAWLRLHPSGSAGVV
jgi:two-component system, NarL family, nitrate/nitrite response regulator NarL